MKIKKFLLFCFLFFITGNIYALSNAVYVGDDVLDNELVENIEKTALYDYENNILTLKNYDGKPIQYYDMDPLTVVLEGTNKIISDFNWEGFYSSSGSVTFEGEGSLLITNTYIGISNDGGDLIIDDTDITIQNVSYLGVNAFGGKLLINGNLTIDSNSTEIEEELGYFDGYVGIQAKNDIEINGNLTIKNANSGISSNGDVIVKSGVSTIQAKTLGIHCANEFLINGGKLDIEVSTEEELPSIYGIDSGSINITNGYLHVLVPENGIAIISFGEYEEDPSITIENQLSINPTGNKVLDIDDVIPSKVIGKDTGSIANELTITSSETITFNTNGGNNIENQIVAYNSKATKPSDPTKENYTFMGWFTDNETFLKEFDFNTEITNNITLYAKWKANEYNITVNVNDSRMGSASSKFTTATLGTLVELTTVSNDGYHFLKWESEDVDATNGTFEMPNHNVTVTAIFEEDKKYEYEFIKGDNQTLTINDINEFTFTIDGDYSLFENLKIDDLELIKDEDYKVTEGSTIITFTQKGIAKLNTLKLGTHNIEVSYSNGKIVTSELTIKDVETDEPTSNPQTNDNIITYVCILFISLVGLLTIVIKKKQRN